MKISPITNIKTGLKIILATTAIVLTAPNAKATEPILKDTFTITTPVIPPLGTEEAAVLKNAPKPDITINGEKKKATIIVDLTKNILYRYDKNGEAIKAYLVASGKEKTPTKEGVRVVSHVERYPYKTAPVSTKRRKKPWDYGPRVICLNTIDPKTGKTGSTGQFIHGNHNPKSLGQYASLGCIRMDNTVIKELAQEVKRGDIVIIKRINHNLLPPLEPPFKLIDLKELIQKKDR